MKFIKSNALYIAWTTSVVAALGSLYFSEVRNFAPCVLCWYQRICMYPLVLISGAGILRKDKNVVSYALPLASIGWLTSIYHNLLYYKIIPESAAPCVSGVSCTTKFIEYFGFVSIPLLSLSSFSIILLCLWVFWKTKNSPTTV